MRSNDVFLEVKNCSKRWGQFTALEEVSFSVKAGAFLAVLGPSGCGKTTLLRIIAGLEEQSQGTVRLAGKDISDWPAARRGCGIVFQSYALFPNLTARQNVGYGIKRKETGRSRRKARVDELLDLVGLRDWGESYPAQMSGGQQQRVALARALAIEPRVLLLDEPLSALDAKVRVRLRHEIRSLQERLGVTTLLVTHDQEEALTMADSVLVMNRGRLVQNGTPQQVYRSPKNKFVADFIGFMNFLEGWTVTREGRLARDASVTTCFRPEDAMIGTRSEPLENVLFGAVRDVEFRGSFYRVTVDLVMEGAAVATEGVDIDVQPERAERLGLTAGDSLSVHIPGDKIFTFSREP